MTREIQVTFDAADPGALCAFWCEVLGYEIDAPAARLRDMGRSP